MPLLLALYVLTVAPLSNPPLRYHWYVIPVPVLAVSMFDNPAQNVVLPVMVAVAPVPNVTLTVADADVQPDCVTTTS